MACCATNISVLCNLRANMVLPNGSFCHSNCGKSQEIAQFRIQTEGEMEGDTSMASSRSQPRRYCKMACKVAHPALETAETAPTARHVRSASKRQLRRRGNAQPSDAAPRRLKSGDSSAVQMPLVWGRRRIYFSAKSCLMAAAGLAFLRFFLFPSSSSSLQRLH